MTKRHKGLGQWSTHTEAELGGGHHGQRHWVKTLHFLRSLLSNSTVRFHNFPKNRHCTRLQGCDLQVTPDGNMALEDTDLRKTRTRERRVGVGVGAAGRRLGNFLAMFQEGMKVAPGFCHTGK